MTKLKNRRKSLEKLRLTPLYAAFLASCVALLIYLSTLQLGINGSLHPYTTDVGEIQNALPRWGTIHFTGYPQFTFLGSLFVSLMGLVGLSPAAAGSLFSALWGAISVGLLTYLATMFAVPIWAAILAALLFGVSTSFWVDASIAEVHTMTMALSFGAIIAAVSYGRSGKDRHLFILAFLAGQGLAHQRAIGFLGLGLLILILPRWRQIARRLPLTIALFLVGPLTYIYLPIRAWMGADWTFSAPGTWIGFWSIVFDNKAERIVEVPESSAQWSARVQGMAALLADDWPWLLLLFGLLALLLAGSNINRRERTALTLIWIPYLVVGFIIWIGRVGEAVLAIKLMVVAMAALGLSFLFKQFYEWDSAFSLLGLTLGLLSLLLLVFTGRPDVIEITRNPAALQTIEIVDGLDLFEDGRSTTFMALEGNDYWQLSYMQKYEKYFPELEIVKHSRNFSAVLDRGDRLMTLSHTFFRWPLETWEGLLGPVALSLTALGVIEISREQPKQASDLSETIDFDLENGIIIRSYELNWLDSGNLRLTVLWQAAEADLEDYSVAVHLIAIDPPATSEDILSQADRNHPVDGWYPSSRWSEGEVVRDIYLINVPSDSQPAAVRVGLYQQLTDGTFNNSPWLSIPLPSSP